MLTKTNGGNGKLRNDAFDLDADLREVEKLEIETRKLEIEARMLEAQVKINSAKASLAAPSTSTTAQPAVKTKPNFKPISKPKSNSKKKVLDITQRCVKPLYGHKIEFTANTRKNKKGDFTYQLCVNSPDGNLRGRRIGIGSFSEEYRKVIREAIDQKNLAKTVIDSTYTNYDTVDPVGYAIVNPTTKNDDLQLVFGVIGSNHLLFKKRAGNQEDLLSELSREMPGRPVEAVSKLPEMRAEKFPKKFDKLMFDLVIEDEVKRNVFTDTKERRIGRYGERAFLHAFDQWITQDRSVGEYDRSVEDFLMKNGKEVNVKTASGDGGLSIKESHIRDGLIYCFANLTNSVVLNGIFTVEKVRELIHLGIMKLKVWEDGSRSYLLDDWKQYISSDVSILTA